MLWFDGREALALPDKDEAILVVPAVNPIDDTLWSYVEGFASRVERVELRPDDFNPYFDRYRWSVEGSAEALKTAMEPAEEPGTVPADVGGHLSFLGYRLEETDWTSGSTYVLHTFWRVERPLPQERHGILFVQLLDGQNQVVAQSDRLDVPSWGWQEGERFVQVHRLDIPDDASAGAYTLIAGAYTVPDRVDAVLAGKAPDPAMPRLSVTDDEGRVTDHIVLRTIEVE